MLPDLGELTRRHVELIAAGRSADLSAEIRQRVEDAAKGLPADADWFVAARLHGIVASHRDWILANRATGRPRQQVRDLFKSFDVVLCPPMPTPAFAHDHSPGRQRHLDIDGKQVPYGHQIAWASMATVLGLPATVAPIGHSEEGLPIGVQIIGPYLEDRTTIAFAGLISAQLAVLSRHRLISQSRDRPGQDWVHGNRRYGPLLNGYVRDTGGAGDRETPCDSDFRDRTGLRVLVDDFRAIQRSPKPIPQRRLPPRLLERWRSPDSPNKTGNLSSVRRRAAWPKSNLASSPRNRQIRMSAVLPTR